MFNGIIKYTGKVNNVSKKRNWYILTIFTKMKFNKNEIGSSVSCSGACLTLESVKKNLIQFYLSKETLSKTIYKSINRGDIINIEKSIIYGQRISGHFVQGHVDTISLVKKIHFIGKSWVIDFHVPKKYRKYLIEKGSIAINGVSLTIAKVLKKGFQIAVIPKTLMLTNLMNLKEKDFVNVELDILGKYIKKYIK